MKTATASIRAYDKPRAAAYHAMMKVAGYGVYGHLLGAIRDALLLNSLRRDAVIVDLGCGTGNLSLSLAPHFPRASFIGVDGSESMLKRARARLAGKARFDCVCRDFGRADWAAGLPAADAVVSSGAIHHLSAGRKRALYGRAAALLKPGGLFVNGDILRGATPALGRIYEDFWIGRMLEGLRKYSGANPSRNAVRARHRAIQKREKDTPGTLDEQLAWLREGGFTGVECYWKLFGFAVFGGIRGRRAATNRP